MRRIILTSVFFITCLFIAEAQRLDIDKVSFVYSYRLMPNIAMDKSYQTYSVKINKAERSYGGDTSTIKIAGRKRVASNAHFTVHIDLGTIDFGSSEIKSRVEVTKDKDGKETRRTRYYTEFRYSFEATANVKDFKDSLLANYKISSRDNAKVYKSSEYGTREDASRIYNTQIGEISARLKEDEIKLAFEFFNNELKKDFAIQVISPKDYLWTLGSEKHPEYKAWQDACGKVKIVLEKITADSIPYNAYEQIEPSMKYFSDIVSKYTNPDEKSEKKIRYAAYFNLALINFCLEKLDPAKEYAEKLIANDYDTGDGKTLLQISNTVKSRFEKHQISSQHFPLEYHIRSVQ